MNRPPRALGYMGLGFVGVSAVTALRVIWLIGGTQQPLLTEFGDALPTLTLFVLRHREGTSLAVLSVFAGAILIHRHRRAVLLLVLLGLTELSISAVVWLALWWPLKDGFKS